MDRSGLIRAMEGKSGIIPELARSAVETAIGMMNGARSVPHKCFEA